LAHNNLSRLFIGRTNGLETAALPLSPLAANLLLTLVLLIVFSRMALIYDEILPAVALLLCKEVSFMN
jgi:cytochrome c oxidase subunit IV